MLLQYISKATASLKLNLAQNVGTFMFVRFFLSYNIASIKLKPLKGLFIPFFNGATFLKSMHS